MFDESIQALRTAKSKGLAEDTLEVGGTSGQ